MKRFRRAALAVALVGAGVVAVSMASPAQALDGQILTDNPISSITISPTLNCSVQRAGDTTGAFYQNSGCGTFIAAGGVLYGPAVVPGGDGAGLASPRTVFTPVSQTPQVGSGSFEDPYTTKTVVNAGSKFQVTEIDSYVAGREYYRTSITVERLTGEGGAPSGTPVSIWHAADCRINGDDSGFGTHTSNHTVGCQVRNGEGNKGDQIIQLVPRTGSAKYAEGGYGDVWKAIGTQSQFADTCVCTEVSDNALGLSFAVVATTPQTVSLFSNFSPSGNDMVNDAPGISGAYDPHASNQPMTQPITAYVNESRDFNIYASDIDLIPSDFPDGHPNFDNDLALTVDPPAAGDHIAIEADIENSHDSSVAGITVTPTATGDFVLHAHVTDGFYTVDRDFAIHVAILPTFLVAHAALIDLGGPKPIPLAMAATLTSQGKPVANKIVYFDATTGGTCFAVTNGAGYASCAIIVSAVQALLGLHYQATFPADNKYGFSTAGGQLLGLGATAIPTLPLP